MKKIGVLMVVMAMVCVLGGIAQADLNDGLVAYYPFNGNAYDESVNENHGTPYPVEGGPTLIEDQCGNPDSAHSFDGEDDRIEVSDSDSLRIPGPLSIAAFFRLDSQIPWQSAPIAAKWGTTELGTAGYGLLAWKSASVGSVGFAISSSGRNVVRAITDNPPLGEWHHLAGVFSGEVLRLYIDGEQVAEKIFEGSIYQTDASLVMGSYNPERTLYVGPLNGIIDEVRVYNRVLSAAEIEELYHLGDCTQPCDCPDTDGDGVPDAWDECLDTPVGSCVYSNGCPCPGYTPLFICTLEPNVANPGDVIKIFGSGFGSMQGDSILHIGDETFDQNSSNVQLWSDCKIEFMVSEHECGWYGFQEYREEDVWVTVNDEDSNKRTLKIKRPKDCAFCSDNLWNIRVNAEDFFHSNEAWVRPRRGSTDDGWGKFEGGYGYEFQWHHGPYTQPSGSVSSTLSWTINDQGKLKVTGTRDHQWHAWTYAYASAPKTLQIPFASRNGTSVPRFFLNQDFDAPYCYASGIVTLNLLAGWNRIDVTGYNQNDNFKFDLNYNLAKNVDRMNSTECTTDNGCICPTVYLPVCGVDGNTYSNGCYAECAGVDVDYTGECTP